MVIVLCLVLLLLLIWYVHMSTYTWHMPTWEALSGSPGSSGLPDKRLDCNSSQVLIAAKSYYDANSPYIMDVISSVPKGTDACNIKFRPIPYAARTGLLKNTETDARQFTFERNPEGWIVANMGEKWSGF